MNSAETEEYLKIISENWENQELCENLLRKVIAESPDNREVLLSAYRFYFYSKNFEKALSFALKVQDQLATSLHKGSIMPDLSEALKKDPENPELRLLMQTVSAIGFLQARLGRRKDAVKTLSFAKDLDPELSFGADAVYKFLTSPPETEE